LQEIESDFVKFEAADTILNNFDFTSRAQQKEGPTDEMINLKTNAKVFYFSDTGRMLKDAVVIKFVTPSPADKENIIREESQGFKQIQTCLKEWLAKVSVLPCIRINETGETFMVRPRVFVVHSCRRAVAWRIQLPIRLGYAFSIYKCHRMKLKEFMVTIT
jgi:hypothetical protein